MAGALVSPLHWLGEHLFTFHMIEHEIVMALSAPLLVLARPVGDCCGRATRWPRLAIRPMARGPCGRRRGMAKRGDGARRFAWDRNLGVACANGYSMLPWQCRLPPACSISASWRQRACSGGRSFASNAGVAAWHLFVTMLHTSMLGALMALAPRVIYVAQTAAAAEWGLTPLEDQQLAGIVMWVPAGTVYAGAALALIALWIRHAEENQEGSRMPFALSKRSRSGLIIAALIALSAAAAAMSWSVQHQSEAIARAMTGGDPSRAPDIIRRYGCAGCHTISGIPGGDGQVGGSLTDIKHRVYVGGVLPTRRKIWFAGSCRRRPSRRDPRCRRPEFRKLKHAMSPHTLFPVKAAYGCGVGRGRKRLDIGRNRVSVALRQHGGVGHDVAHRRTNPPMVRGIAGLQRLRDIAFGTRRRSGSA